MLRNSKPRAKGAKGLKSPKFKAIKNPHNGGLRVRVEGVIFF